MAVLAPRRTVARTESFMAAGLEISENTAALGGVLEALELASWVIL